MKITVDLCVYNSSNIQKNIKLKINSNLAKKSTIKTEKLIAYPPFINAHDHLISDWYPKAGFGHKYKNVNGWIKNMKDTDSFMERNRIWLNDGSFDLTNNKADLIIQLGIYKNLSSGCAIVQDHIPKQKTEYYQNNFITIIEDYAQCHSISMGNWWGGESAVNEWKKTEGKIPFIIHLAEGKDEIAKQSFSKLEKLNLLQPNTMLIHGIALSKEDIEKCVKAGTSICWCPESNLYLIGETLDIETCLEAGVNIAMGTDATMSGSTNLFSELKFAKKYFPNISAKDFYKMITENACKALCFNDTVAELKDETSELLLLNKRSDDPFENILKCDMNDIQLFIHKGIPLYGDTDFLSNFEVDPGNYYFYENNRFIIGNPQNITNKINIDMLMKS